MKKICLISPVIISAFLFLTSCGPSGPKGEVDIKDATHDTIIPAANLTGHKAGDVEVNRVIFFGPSYQVIYYQMENDSLKTTSASMHQPMNTIKPAIIGSRILCMCAYTILPLRVKNSN